MSKANSTVDIGLLEHCVREDLKQEVENRNVVENPIKVVITNYPEDKTEEMEIENNREVPEMGNRSVPFSRELYVDGDDFMEVPVKKYFRAFFRETRSGSRAPTSSDARKLLRMKMVP